MLADKNVDVVVYNDVSRSDIGFDAKDNEVVLITRRGERRIDKGPKARIAAAVIDEAVGEGRTVAFGFEPNFRAFTDGTQRVLWNAMFGPDPEARATARASSVARATRRLRVAREPVRVVVRARGAAAARRLIAAETSRFRVVRARRRVTFLLANPADATGDEHPFADRLAMRLRNAKVPVVLYRAP
jgi:hypothetical protein